MCIFLRLGIVTGNTTPLLVPYNTSFTTSAAFLSEAISGYVNLEFCRRMFYRETLRLLSLKSVNTNLSLSYAFVGACRKQKKVKKGSSCTLLNEHKHELYGVRCTFYTQNNSSVQQMNSAIFQAWKTVNTSAKPVRTLFVHAFS